MRVTNPGFTVPLGRVRDSNGTLVPLYIGQEWQIFFQGLFERTGGSESDRIDALEEVDTQQTAQIDDAGSRATQSHRDSRVNAAAIEAALVRLNDGEARLKEIEFLGAFSWG